MLELTFDVEGTPELQATGENLAGVSGLTKTSDDHHIPSRPVREFPGMPISWESQRNRTMLFEVLERVVLEEMSRTLQASMRMKLGLSRADPVDWRLLPLDALDERARILVHETFPED